MTKQNKEKWHKMSTNSTEKRNMMIKIHGMIQKEKYKPRDLLEEKGEGWIKIKIHFLPFKQKTQKKSEPRQSRFNKIKPTSIESGIMRLCIRIIDTELLRYTPRNKGTKQEAFLVINRLNRGTLWTSKPTTCRQQSTDFEKWPNHRVLYSGLTPLQGEWRSGL